MRLRFLVRAEIFLFSNCRYRLWKPHIYSMFSLSYDRSVISFKSSSPESAIQCFRFQIPVSSLFSKVIQQLPTSSFSFFSPFCLSFYEAFQNAVSKEWRAGIAQSVQRLATDWKVRGSNPSGGEIFRTYPDRPWGLPSLLYNGYRVFPGGKGDRVVTLTTHPPLSSAEVMKEQSYTSTHPLGPFGLLQGETLPNLPL